MSKFELTVTLEWKSWHVNRTSGVEGQVYVNGVDRELKSFRKHSVYISQQDHLLTNLTVDEYMISAAHLKLGNRVPINDKLSMVQYMPLIFISSGTWQWNWIFFFFFLDWTCNENAGVNGKQTYANRLLVGWRMQKAFDRTGVAGQSRHPLSWRTNQVNMQLYLMTDDKNLWLENTQDRVYLLFRYLSTDINQYNL
jgi:hypothetical protein